MPEWTMRFLVISLFSILFFSCKSYQLPDAVKKEITRTEFENPYFANSETDYIYKANVEIYGRKAGGIFVAKRINSEVHRVVFTTDFGSKMMDFEISETDFKVNYILEDLDRKMVLNTLRDDFRLLLKVNHKVKKAFENDTFEILDVSQGKKNQYFYLNKKDQKPVKLLVTSKRKEKVVFEFDSKNSILAESIKIIHKNIRLTIELKNMTDRNP